MPGKVSFIFDDGLVSAFQIAYPLFKKRGMRGCLAIFADFAKNQITVPQALAMQEDGWEIMSHSVRHIPMDDRLLEKEAAEEIRASREILEAQGFAVRQFVAPMSACAEKWLPLLYSAYDAAYTVYKDSAALPAEELVIRKPVRRYELHRASLSGKSLGELKEYIDYVSENDEWIVFYCHGIGEQGDVSGAVLSGLLDYIAGKGAKVLTGSEAVESSPCKTHRIRSGYDGERCLVHARAAADGKGLFLATAQYLNVKGSDLFSPIMFSKSTDGGRSFSEFLPDGAFAPVEDGEGNFICGCDATPMYHEKTGKFLVIGHTVRYASGSMGPVPGRERTFYAVFDPESNGFCGTKLIEMPDEETYFRAGNGSGQSLQLANGDLLIPFYYTRNASDKQYSACVMRCSFDGETVRCIECGNSLSKPGEPRGLCEPSIVRFNDKYYLTLRGDLHGYCAVSEDGLLFSEASLWRWDDGELLENYNTQQHWMVCGGSLFLVYTRRAGTNDHVFRHRAPLFAARVDPENMSLVRASEFIAVPERGARLGNFGVFSESPDRAFIMAAEWMQPAGCEKYGSDNSVYLTEIRIGDRRG